MFEQFAQSARQAVADARQEAAKAGQDQIRSEHVLVGLVREPGLAADALTAAGLDAGLLRDQLPHGDHEAPADLDAEALATLGIDLDAVRRAADAAFGPGALDRASVPGRFRMPLSPDAKQALIGAVRHAHSDGRRQISSGHLLLGILDQKRNGALTVLAGTGTDVAALRADIVRRLGTSLAT
jgi:ATP-dependent Clp protease ATP-binding subunit ClpA